MKATMIVATLVLLACPAGAQLMARDQTGHHVYLPTPPERVVSAYGPATYFVYALGEGDRLVAARYVALTDTGGEVGALHQRLDPHFSSKLMRSDPTVEDIVAQRADLVLANPVKNRGILEILREDLSVPVAGYSPESLDSVLQAVVLTGTLLGPQALERAYALVGRLESSLRTLDDALAGLSDEQRPRVLFVGVNPSRVAGGAMLQTELIARAGGRSVTAELAGGWPEVSVEQLLSWDPEVIVIAPYGQVEPETLLDDPHWAGISAVRKGKVYKMPRVAAPWDAPVPDAVLGTLWLAQILHPQLVLLDAAEEACFLYEHYYGLSLPEALVASLRVP